jgi:hypothetical protein
MVPDSMYPWPAHYVREIRVFDRRFVPLVVKAEYRIPATGGSVVITRHALGRHVPTPFADPDYLNVLRPRGNRVNGVPLPGGAIKLGTVLYGPSPNPQLDIPGGFRAFDRAVVEACRGAWWKLQNVRETQRIEDIARHEVAAKKAATAAHSNRLLEAKRDDTFRIKRALGVADRVYLNDANKPAASAPLKGAA